MKHRTVLLHIAAMLSLAHTTFAQIAVPVPSGRVVTPADTFGVGNPGLIMSLRRPALVFPSWLFPVRGSQKAAERFWAQPGTAILASAAITAQSQVLGANVELLSDLIGPIRVGLGGNVTAESPSNDAPQTAVDAAEQATVTRLLQNGGLIHLTGSYPVFCACDSTGNRALASTVRIAAALDAPSVNQLSDLKGLAGMAGLDLLGQAIGGSGVLGVEGGVYGQLFLINDHFAESISASSNSAAVIGARVGLIVQRKTHVGVYLPLTRSSSLDGRIKTVVYVQQTLGR